jgi:ElaA protein
MLNFQEKNFNQLTVSELYAIMKLRQEIFVVEQNCVYLDADGYDQKAIHVLGTDEAGKLGAYIRIFAPGDCYDEAAIGRVVVNANFRGQKLGIKVMEYGIHYCKKHFSDSSIKIGAQVYLDKFYRSLGFIPVSEMYLEDGIEHQYMKLNFRIVNE